MPVILPPEAWDLWLSPTLDPAVAVAMLDPYPPQDMETYPISTRVNSPKNNDAAIVEPVPLSATTPRGD